MKLKTILFLIIIFVTIGWVLGNQQKTNSYTDDNNTIQWHHVTYGSQNNSGYPDQNIASPVNSVAHSIQGYGTTLKPYLYTAADIAKTIIVDGYFYAKEKLPSIVNYLTTPSIEDNNNDVPARHIGQETSSYAPYAEANDNNDNYGTNDDSAPATLQKTSAYRKHVYRTDNRFIHTVCIDPGHGGKDPGAIGINGLEEKNVTLSIGLKLAHLLRVHKYKVIMTRTDDYFVSLPQRVRMVNNSNCDILVSIHINASRNIRNNGITTYVNRYFNVNTIKGHNSFILAHLVQGTLVDNLNEQNLGVQQADFYVLRHAHIPAILVEVLFITNPNDVRELRNHSFREDVAWNLFNAIDEIRPGYMNTQLAQR